MKPVNKTLTKILTPLSSMKIAVVLIVLTVILVFVGTTAQKDFGSWDVQRDYFYAWGVMAPLKYFFPLTSWSETAPGKVPLVGGYTIAVAMLINLFAANILRFKLTWRDLLVIPPLVALVWLSGYLTSELGYYVMSAVLVAAALPLIAAAYWLHGKRGGVVLIHLGLVLMLGGELATNVVKVEQAMSIDEGSYANYASDMRYGELAVIDSSNPDHNNVVTVNESRLKPGQTITDARLPFSIHVDAYYPNSDLLGPMQPKPEGLPQATAGAGLRLSAKPLPKATGIGESKADYPAAYVTLTAGGKELGRFLLSQQLNNQPVEVNGKTYEIAVRWPRYYKPFQIHLKDFRFDRHTGTQMARNFSSDVRLVDPTRNEDREVRIWMNHPLRYSGETFYQQTFDPRTETTTVLQVVRNPSWLFPYISCIVGGLGMFAHFSLNLREFSRKRAKADAAQAEQAAAAKPRRKRDEQYTLPPRRAWASAQFLVPAGILAVCVVYLAGVLAPRNAKSVDGFDLSEVAAVPMNYEGRVLPYDSLARITLKIITGGKEDLRKLEGKPANMQFLLDGFSRNERTWQYEIFRIDNPELVSFMGLQPLNKEGKERQLFAWAELEPKVQKLLDEVVGHRDINPKEQTQFQRHAAELWKKVKAFDTLVAMKELHLIAPTQAGGEWRSFEQAMDAVKSTGTPETGLVKFFAILQSYKDGKPTDFNKAVSDYKTYAASMSPRKTGKAGIEVFFNRIAPFYHLMGFYVLSAVLVLFSFLTATGPLRRAAWWVLILTIVIHTGGLIFRMYLQGRPPVTTLYSSAIFIAWGGVLLALGVERFFKNGVGLLVASCVGFLSLFIAHNLSLSDGDSLRELQAVLDTNFWLATHVVLITLGYAATFLAGALAITYVARGFFTPTLNKAAGKDLFRMVYGILCFAMLFSFVGTILGGIWADQSWGRFWGWDPKENGAILIVLWNALILHARWSGLAKERGVMGLAVLGNVVTAWSWFGTNELGVGLHAYGFKEGTRMWLALFAGSQVAIVILSRLPLALWQSGKLLQGATLSGPNSAPTHGKDALATPTSSQSFQVGA